MTNDLVYGFLSIVLEFTQAEPKEIESAKQTVKTRGRIKQKQGGVFIKAASTNFLPKRGVASATTPNRKVQFFLTRTCGKLSHPKRLAEAHPDSHNNFNKNNR